MGSSDFKSARGDDFNSTINARVHWLCKQNSIVLKSNKDSLKKNL